MARLRWRYPPARASASTKSSPNLAKAVWARCIAPRDTRLDRDVALKILAASVAQDLDRLTRFEREAKTLAALNHSHIAQIYGLEQTSAGSALVMELVEGEDLSVRIAHGPMPIDAVLPRPINQELDLAPDGQHIVRIIETDLAGSLSPPINVVLNWFEELNVRAAAR